ncbi:formate dehydrogenase subunit delta [Candidatus Methylobacter oryzae]|uniref:Formate dehydrogenase subunit delta n=1 Tax=Candidatus Methylobacter oryzae TaxID=2497749 RepID=A0ABY3CCP7_9GAMM|nr:formate dehydrogenase subunit delta [Candidatus Methylobacter oryzae]TRW98058.1 formate dehydrogenase subunit delta [Candidatus Methylobacter oryzae]
MKIERLIKMANDIGNFFNSEPDKEIAAEGIKNHILRSWDPRMRKSIIAYCQEDGAELNDLVKAAISKLPA